MKLLTTTYLKEIEIKYKFKKVRTEKADPEILPSDRVAKFFQDLQFATKENFLIVNLDIKNQILCYETVAIGLAHTVLMRPMEVFRTSFVFNTYSVVILHNHPSGA